MVKIFIDSGHGGTDSGAVGNGLQEKNVTLQIAKAMESQLKGYQNVEIKMSRTTDTAVSLRQRTDMANSWGADVLVSVHINSSASASARGFESYIYPTVDARTVAFQNVLHSEIWTVIDNYTDDNRGKKRADFHMLRESSMMAVLTENLFISNSADAKLLKSQSFINALATGHVNGIVKYFGLKKNESESPSPQPTGKTWIVQVGAFSNKELAQQFVEIVERKNYDAFVKHDGKYFIVQVGAFSNRENADNLKQRLEKDGFEAIIK
jgi:N-acetylmuramoyl-L-alanine amidase